MNHRWPLLQFPQETPVSIESLSIVLMPVGFSSSASSILRLGLLNPKLLPGLLSGVFQILPKSVPNASESHNQTTSLNTSSLWDNFIHCSRISERNHLKMDISIIAHGFGEIIPQSLGYVVSRLGRDVSCEECYTEEQGFSPMGGQEKKGEKKSGREGERYRSRKK